MSSVSDARAEYEAAVDSATADLARETTIAYQKMRAACEVAWYTYCVRSGMVSVPTREGQDNDQGSDSTPAGIDGDPGNGGDGESVAGEDDSAQAGEGTEEPPDAGADDAEAPPDSR